MKHILKPVGHCLATAVVTSTLLRGYPASIAHAANSPETPLPTQNQDAHAGNGSQDSALDETSAPAVSELSDANSPLTVETIVAPAVAGTTVSNSPDASSPTHSSSQSSRSNSVQPAASQSASSSESTLSSTREAPLTVPQETPPEVPDTLSKQATKQSPAPQPGTLAAMRQQLDQKLAAIVARDKAAREAQLQQNLIRVALRYAEVRAFDLARQVARHPALSLELQTTLLAQIDQIAAQTPAETAKQSAVATADSPEAARTIPSQSLAYVPLGQSWTGSFAVPQCPVTDMPSSETAVPLRQSSSPSREKSLPELGNRIAATLAATAKRFPLEATARQTPVQPAVKPAVKPIHPVTAKLSTQKPTVKPAANKPAILKPVTTSLFHQAAIVRSEAVNYGTADHAAAKQTITSDRFALQPASPLEVMGYWMSKPLQEVGIRLPFVPMWSGTTINAQTRTHAQADTHTQAEKSAIEAASIQSFPALPSLSWGSTGETNLSQPVLSFSPSLLTLEGSLAELRFAAKDAVKLSSPAIQTVSQTTSSPKTPQLAVSNCFSPVSPSANLTLSPAVARQMGWGNLSFPLPIPAALTSAFGWRIHPLSGDRRFHAGIDLGAPMGTPVVAAMAGRIVAADLLGGYGLAVVVETSGGSYRNLYAHLSGVAVRPGTVVQQGSILGWVGSTGNSTGPHLHFETQIPTANGWMAIDPLSATARTIANRGTEAAKR